MATFIEEMADLAAELLGEFKTGVVKLIKPPGELDVSEDADPLDPYAGSQTEEIKRDAFVSGMEDGEGAIIAGKRQVLIAGGGFEAGKEPKASDGIEIDGAPHSIGGVKAIPAAGPVALYIIQASTAAR
jgi:hypothetical protein